MPSVFIQNFGCRANQAEGAALAAGLAQAGWTQAARAAAADWVILNSCTVTAEADVECQRALRRLRRLHPAAKIAVAGCYAQRAPREVAELEGVARVLLRGENLVNIAPLPHAPVADAGRARPVIKVQEGCDRRCSYCIVPSVRGASRSLPMGQVLATVEAAVAAGHNEVVISGINLGQWGHDRGESLRLPDLIAAILDRTPLPRLRLSSIEPVDWTGALTGWLSHPRVARHAHLPLQSGSDAVLRRMRRRYRAADFAALLQRLRAQAPLAALGTDLIAGFPGETEAEFAETLALVEALPLTYAHVFPFSPRPGTEAAQRLASGEWRAIPAPMAAERAQRLRACAATKKDQFIASLIGMRLPAIGLHDGTALTDNYLSVALAEPVKANRMLEIAITASNADDVRAKSLEAACAA